MTLFTSDIRAGDKFALKAFITYGGIAVFCLLFSMVYEHFSHGVYSGFMIFAFSFPLFAGALPFLAIYLKRTARPPGFIVLFLHGAAISALTVGSILQGVLEIYGTTNGLVLWYWIAGGVLMAAALIVYLLRQVRLDKGL